MFCSLSLVEAKKWLRRAALLLVVVPGAALAQTTDFVYTGQPQTYTVPAGTTRLSVVAVGAAGGRVSRIQARSTGAEVRATIAVVPGEVLTVVVGEQGADGSGADSYNGGGGGGGGAGSGGGATDLRRAGVPTGDYLATRNALLVAGGAGGTDWINSPTPQGGTGGAPYGGDGVGLSGNVPGKGATQRAVGGGGIAGSQGEGGSGGYGGGGGGYYGGGAAGLNGNSGGGGGGSSWVAPAAVVGAPTYGLADAATAGRLSITALPPDGPLPVQLTAFTAQLRQAGVDVAWHTASEVNSAHFEIERSLDGRTFARLGTVAAGGTTSQARAYAFRDAQLPAGASTLYYRLRQVDLDGSAHYSPVRAVALAAGGVAFGAEAYPNPWADELHVRLAGFGPEPVRLALYDATGRLVLSHTAAAAEQLALPGAATLPGGVYALRISQGSQQLVVKLAH
ncbi:MAG TPA: T9SS type A sorting domain-containing protein [Hymenobacter sp.]|uniref:T9SS type A sorting domain-containing protein n=1 Tax=Hymenobacter sp. TaxID=1898978 RepID=UPI002D8022A1|nr:T9SS type A sorting domain-containing protein [Hymenobacter sp.]HET9502618.1 T9SS type A sorting domain-containing protein [Hymenobacter sp.]